MDILGFILMLVLLGVFQYMWRGGKFRQPTPKAKDDSAFNQYCSALNNTEMHNLIISGGNAADRFLAITKILNEASRRNIPTIVLHAAFAPLNQFSQNIYYDPCIGKDPDEVAEILTDAAANALNIDNAVHSSIKFIVDLMQTMNNGDIGLSAIVKFPTDDVLTFLDDCRDSGKLGNAQYDRFKQRYNNPAIKDNIFKVAPLLTRLKVIAQNNDTAQAINFRKAVSERKILFFDLLSDSNAVLKELIFADLNKLIEISKFWVVTEGISFMGKPESKVDTLFLKNRNNITLIYSGEDVPALTSQTENTFETLAGGNAQLLLYSHTASASAEKWSKHFGEEYKTKVSTNSGTNYGWIFMKGSNKGSSIATEKGYVCPPQYFMKSARTTNINNQTVTWGLNEGECYFISGDPSMQKSDGRTSAFSALLELTNDGYLKLPKITLQQVELELMKSQAN